MVFGVQNVGFRVYNTGLYYNIKFEHIYTSKYFQMQDK